MYSSMEEKKDSLYRYICKVSSVDNKKVAHGIKPFLWLCLSLKLTSLSYSYESSRFEFVSLSDFSEIRLDFWAQKLLVYSFVSCLLSFDWGSQNRYGNFKP